MRGVLLSVTHLLILDIMIIEFFSSFNRKRILQGTLFALSSFQFRASLILLALYANESFAAGCNFDAATPGPHLWFQRCVRDDRMWSTNARSMRDAIQRCVRSASCVIDVQSTLRDNSPIHPFVLILRDSNAHRATGDQVELMTAYSRICGILSSSYSFGNLTSRQEQEIRNMTGYYVDGSTCLLVDQWSRATSSRSDTNARVNTRVNPRSIPAQRAK